MKNEPIGVLAAVAMVTTQLLHAYAPEMPAELVSAIGVIVVAVARRFVTPLRRHYETVTDAIANAKTEVRQHDDPRGAAGLLVVVSILALGAACAPPPPPDFTEQLRQARAAGHAEAMGMAGECLGNQALETERAVLACIFGDAAVAQAPDRSPSRADQLRDQATGAVGGLLDALGRRGAAEIEGR